MLWLKECPMWWGDQGLVRPIVTANNNVVLVCDECSTVWCEPDNVKEDGPYVEPSEPDWSACGDHLKPGTTRWANREDVQRVGWDNLEWHDDQIDPVQSPDQA